MVSDIPAGDEHIEKLFLQCTLGLKEKFLLFKEVSFPGAQLSYRSNKFEEEITESSNFPALLHQDLGQHATLTFFHAALSHWSLGYNEFNFFFRK